MLCRNNHFLLYTHISTPIKLFKKTQNSNHQTEDRKVVVLLYILICKRSAISEFVKKKTISCLPSIHYDMSVCMSVLLSYTLIKNCNARILDFMNFKHIVVKIFTGTILLPRLCAGSDSGAWLSILIK